MTTLKVAMDQPSYMRFNVLAFTFLP